jgi:short-subunit dehydrogenase
VAFWKEKVALITGGSAGLGLAIAQALVSSGAKVAIVGRNAKKLASAASSLQRTDDSILPISADITRQDDVERMVAETISKFGRIDVLVNCAGQSTRGEVQSTLPEEFQRLWEINFLALVRCTQAALPHLIASHGHIVNIGSLASKSASRFLGAYPASKFPVAAFSQQLRLELGAQVHTLLVCPGPIQREDAGERYAEQSANLPESAGQPGGGVKLKGIPPDRLAALILRACERRQAELVVPWRAKVLFAISQLWPQWGDWLIRKMSS